MTRTCACDANYQNKTQNNSLIEHNALCILRITKWNKYNDIPRYYEAFETLETKVKWYETLKQCNFIELKFLKILCDFANKTVSPHKSLIESYLILFFASAIINTYIFFRNMCMFEDKHQENSCSIIQKFIYTNYTSCKQTRFLHDANENSLHLNILPSICLSTTIKSKSHSSYSELKIRRRYKN